MPNTVRYPIDRRRLLASTVIVVALLAAAAAAILVASLRSGSDTPHRPIAAIVDQLAITDPDPAFIASAKKHLADAGYRVDYYAADEVTVDMYRQLPNRGYSFVLLRSHSSGSLPSTNSANGRQSNVPSVGLFTNEQYSETAHVDEQYAQRLTRDFYGDDRQIPWAYFGVTASFIRLSARGTFPGATVVLMGCDGLEAQDLAQAFIDRGAKQFISWDSSVTAAHTDEATENLLQHMLDEQMSAGDAIARTMSEVGPDPSFGAKLALYPPSRAD